MSAGTPSRLRYVAKRHAAGASARVVADTDEIFRSIGRNIGVAFMGETSDVNLADLLSVLARRLHSGRLAISLEGEEIQLFLDQGRIVSVSSSNHGMRIGQTMVRLGLLDPVQLESAVREQEETGTTRPLGEILFQNGWVTRADLARGAEEQCIEALTRVIVAKQGTFMFSRDSAPRATTALVTLHTDGIVLEASRRADELITLRSLLPPPGAQLGLATPAPTSLDTLVGWEARVVEELVKGTGNLAEIAQRIPGDNVALWRAIVGLRERGVLITRGTEITNAAETPVEDERLPDRTAEEIVALGREGRSGRVVTTVPTLAEIRLGTQASTQTVAAVTLVVRDVIAAFNAGSPLRSFVHFSDDHFRRQGPLNPEEVAVLRAPVRPLPPEEQETVVAVRDVRQLADGRVSAILVSHYPTIGEIHKVLIFARFGDRWRIDAAIEAPQPAASTPQPAQANAAQVEG
jgi:hypothetical protein